MNMENVVELTLNEKVFIVRTFYQNQNNVLAVLERFKRDFKSDVPNSCISIFLSLVAQFEAIGSVTQPAFYYRDHNQSPKPLMPKRSHAEIESENEEEFDEIKPNSSMDSMDNHSMPIDTSHSLLMMFSEPMDEMEASTEMPQQIQMKRRRKRRTKLEMEEARQREEEIKLKRDMLIKKSEEEEEEDEECNENEANGEAPSEEWAQSNTPRELKERCKCKTDEKTKLKCHLVTENDRQRLMEHFWSLSWNDKSTYVNEMIVLLPTRFKKKGINGEEVESRRSQTLEYFMKSSSGTVRVCKTMFSNTFDIPKATVWNWKANQGNLNLERKRVKRGSRGPKQLRKPDSWEALKRFFDELPKVEFDEDPNVGLPKRTYLQSRWTTKKDLYQYYKDWCAENSSDPLSMAVFSNFMAQENVLLMKEDQQM